MSQPYRMPWERRSLKCLIGFHNFTVLEENKFRAYPIRTCNNCHLEQEGTYDMCYGGTIWTNLN